VSVFVAALCYAEIGCVVRTSGADYAYLDAAYGSILSFVFSWCWALLLKPATIAASSLTSAQYILAPLFDDGCGSAPDTIKKLLALFILRETNLELLHRVESVQFWVGLTLYCI